MNLRTQTYTRRDSDALHFYPLFSRYSGKRKEVIITLRYEGIKRVPGMKALTLLQQKGIPYVKDISVHVMLWRLEQIQGHQKFLNSKEALLGPLLCFQGSHIAHDAISSMPNCSLVSATFLHNLCLLFGKQRFLCYLSLLSRSSYPENPNINEDLKPFLLNEAILFGHWTYIWSAKNNKSNSRIAICKVLPTLVVDSSLCVGVFPDAGGDNGVRDKLGISNPKFEKIPLGSS
ncbi:hypothetical protein BT69DRAFT_1322781 [Atractiella rhizophila]|nr:hypothetical protein BT69DRAFT_1322781 [Atractiella rhizophila]